MLGRPYLFTFLNFAIFAIGLFLTGFQTSIILSACMGIFIILYNRKKIGGWDSIALAIVYLMIFDADIYSYTTFKFRVWYLLLLPLLVHHLQRHHFFRKLPKNGYTFAFFFFGICILLRLITDPLDGKLSILKYLLFSLGAIFVLKESFRSIVKTTGMKPLVDYFISLALFVGVWGILQFGANLSGIGAAFQADYFNFRPSAFFSETTWYAEYLVFGLLFAYYNFQATHQKTYILFLPLFLVGIVLSVTRNAFLALAMWCMTTFFLGLLRTKIKPLHPLLFITAGLAVGIIIYSSSYFDSLVDLLWQKLSLMDDSAQGRIEAIQVSIGRIADRPILGHGFGFNPATDTIADSGTSIGAKHANLFLMIAYIFGLPGLLLLLYLIADMILKQSNRWIKSQNLESKYAVILLIAYLSISMFAPLHQFPCGMFIMAAILLFANPKPNNII